MEGSKKRQRGNNIGGSGEPTPKPKRVRKPASPKPKTKPAKAKTKVPKSGSRNAEAAAAAAAAPPPPTSAAPPPAGAPADAGPQFQDRVLLPAATESMEALPLVHVPENLPMAFRQVLQQACDLRNSAWQDQGESLLQAHARLHEAHIPLAHAADKIGTFHAWLDIVRKLAMVQRAIATLWQGQPALALQRQMDVLAARYIAADDAARHHRQLELAAASRSETRFVPQAPPSSAGSAVGSAVGSAAGSVASSAATTTTAAAAAATELVAAYVNEAAVAFGVAPRPVVLTAFDMCPTCHVALRYNQTLQQLVCPVPGCNHWSRFADMTSNALAYGEEVEFVKHAYNPVTHLDKIMSAAEATESYVVPVEALVRVMQRLYATGARTIADITIARVRQACKDVNVRMDNTVQIYCRIVGRAPRRMTPFMRDQLRIMLCATEAPYRRHAAGRTNHLSFPFSARKDCELLGYWEMVPSFPMLRGQGNVAVHDVITSKVFHDLGWSFTHTLHNHTALLEATGL